jgi:hypothetical protein
LLNKGMNFNLALSLNLQDVGEEWQSVSSQLRARASRDLLASRSSRRLDAALSVEGFRLAQTLARHARKGTLDSLAPHRKFNALIKELLEFAVNNDLVFVKADKGMGITVCRKSWFVDVCSEHLHTGPYVPLALGGDFSRIERKIVQEWTMICRAVRGMQIQHALFAGTSVTTLLDVTRTYRLPQFAPLVKLHKNPIGIRPIIPAPGWYTEHASRWVDEVLRPFLAPFSHIVPDSRTVVRMLDGKQYSTDTVLLTLDVASMYTNLDLGVVIPRLEGYCTEQLSFDESLSHADVLARKEQITLACRLLRFICRNNYFGFNGRTYRQRNGLAMGSPCAPTVADLAMAIFVDLPFSDGMENSLLSHGLIVLEYLRFRDDLLLVVDVSYVSYVPDRVEFAGVTLCRYLNSLAPHSFTLEAPVAGRHVTFCDLSVHLEAPVPEAAPTAFGGLTIRFSPFEKPMNLHLYACPDSYYPDSYKFNWISGENIRLIRNSSSRAVYEDAVKSFKSFLLRRQFPESRVLSQLSKVAYSDRQRYLVGDIHKPQALLPPARVFVHNVPGRHMVSRRATAAYNRAGTTFTTPSSLRVVTYRGYNLDAVSRRLTKAVLSSAVTADE